MSTTKLYPFINKFSGDVQTLTKKQGKKLNEDWHMGKVATNDKGEQVFRFQIATQAPDKDGVMRNATAVVDIQEIKTEVLDDGNQRPE
jgi:hypothetical protein